MVVSGLIILAIYSIIQSIQKRTSKEIASARLFTAKITNLPKYITDESELLSFFDEIYPNELVQFYICKRMEDLRSLEKQLLNIESKISHFEYQMAVQEKKQIFIYSSRWLREVDCFLKFCNWLPFRKNVNAIEYYQQRAQSVKDQISFRKQSPFASTGSLPLSLPPLSFLPSPSSLLPLLLSHRYIVLAFII